MDTQNESIHATPLTSPPPLQRPEPAKSNVVGGLVLIVLGGLFLANNLLPGFDFGDYWPLILVAVGCGMLWNSIRTPH